MKEITLPSKAALSVLAHFWWRKIAFVCQGKSDPPVTSISRPHFYPSAWKGNRFHKLILFLCKSSSTWLQTPLVMSRSTNPQEIFPSVGYFSVIDFSAQRSGQRSLYWSMDLKSPLCTQSNGVQQLGYGYWLWIKVRAPGTYPFHL